jgi:hypothetical protein
VDRVDSWLNPQSAWRLAFAVWILMWPGVILLGVSLYGLYGPQPASLLVLAGVVCCSVAAAAPVAAAMALRLRPRRALPWRFTAGMMLACSGLVLNTITSQRAVSPHAHRVVILASLLLMIPGASWTLLAAVRTTAPRAESR